MVSNGATRRKGLEVSQSNLIYGSNSLLLPSNLLPSNLPIPNPPFHDNSCTFYRYHKDRHRSFPPFSQHV